MKKLLTILFLFSFWANAQIQFNESYAFTKDKKYHTLFGCVSSGGTFVFVLSKGGNDEDALVASCVIPSLFGLGKEGLDYFMGKTISWSDFTYTSGSAIITGGVIYGLKKWKKKRKIKKIKRQLIAEDPEFSLDNEIFIK